MLTTLEFQLVRENNNINISHHIGSLMQGVLMEYINPEYGGFLHQQGLKPYSQHFFYDRQKDSFIWRISTLTEEAGKEILIPLMEKSGERFFIRNKQAYLKIENKKVSSHISYKELAARHFLGDIPRKTVIRFITPTTFKKDGEFTIFPDISNIYKSLYEKWNSFYSHISLEDPQVLEHLIDHTKMIGYNLRSTKFDMERVRINAFKGEVCLLVAGPSSLAAIAGLLFAFGEFSGVGAKCSLGMGGIEIE